MSVKENVKLKADKTAEPTQQQGYLRWFIERKDGAIMYKYNDDGTKNVYADKTKVYAKLTGAASIGLTDPTGNLAAELAVPDGAVVFQRRRGFWGVGGINYGNKFELVETSYPKTVMALVDGGDQGMVWMECTWDNEAGKWYPPKGKKPKQFKVWKERKIVKSVPEITYYECWLIGYRKREADNSVTVHYLAVYPDGKVDEHHAWKEKPWLDEPQWFTEEQV